MGKSLTDAVKNIQTLARALPGVRAAPDFPPGVAPPGVFAVATVSSAGTTLISAGLRRVKATIVCAILKPFKDLARDTEEMLPYYEAFVDQIEADPTLGGAVDTVDTTADIRGRMGVWPYNDIPHFGWRIEVDIKIQS